MRRYSVYSTPDRGACLRKHITPVVLVHTVAHLNRFIFWYQTQKSQSSEASPITIWAAYWVFSISALFQRRRSRPLSPRNSGILPGWIFIKFCWLWKAVRRAVNSSRHRSTHCFKWGCFQTLTWFSKYIFGKSDWGISGPWLAPISALHNANTLKTLHCVGKVVNRVHFSPDFLHFSLTTHDLLLTLTLSVQRRRSWQRSPACSIRHRWKVTTQIQTLDCVSSPCLGKWLRTPSLF